MHDKPRLFVEITAFDLQVVSCLRSPTFLLCNLLPRNAQSRASIFPVHGTLVFDCTKSYHIFILVRLPLVQLNEPMPVAAQRLLASR
jgi:hypothetical protein